MQGNSTSTASLGVHHRYPGCKLLLPFAISPKGTTIGGSYLGFLLSSFSGMGDLLRERYIANIILFQAHPDHYIFILLPYSYQGSSPGRSASLVPTANPFDRGA